MYFFLFETEGFEVRHLIQAENSTDAWAILEANEKDIPLSEFNLNPATLKVGNKPGELLLLTSLHTDPYHNPLDMRQLTAT